MRKRKTTKDRLREKAVSLAHDLDDAARDMVSGRSFAATQLRKAARLLMELAKVWGEQDHPQRGVTNTIATTRQRVRKRKRKS